MRGGVWCAAAALALLTVATALRTPQVEGVSRVGRRLAEPAAPEARFRNNEEAPTYTRTSRRREEIPSRERVQTHSKPLAETEAEPQSLRNERFNSRRTNSRTRNRPNESDVSKDIPTGRDNTSRNRTRLPYRDRQRTLQPTEIPSRTSSTVKEVKPETTSASFKSTPKISVHKVIPSRQDETTPPTISRTSSFTIPESLATTRRRNRINTRIDTAALDLAVSGTTNTLVSNKEDTTARTSPDPRNSRKLRYKQRLSETDTNQTGEEVSNTNEVTKSSQIKEYITTSHPEIQTGTVAVETTEPPIIRSSSSEPSVTKAIPQAKVVRRPLSRNKGNFRSAVSLHKKNSDEISEDDNYPASFKAKLQAKSVMTQSSSPTSESLSVKASQKVFNTYTSSSQSTNTGPAKNKYSRFRSKISPEESKLQETKVKSSDGDEALETNVSTESPASDKPEFKLKTTYSARARKINFLNTSTTVSDSSHSSERPSYKFNRKFRPSSTEASKIESTSKFKRLGTNTLLKKSLIRPSYQSRRNSTISFDRSSEAPVHLDKDSVSKDSNVTFIKTLPRTSYYSRFRGKTLETSSTTSTESNFQIKVEDSAEKKIEFPVDMPLVFSLLQKTNDTAAGKENTTTLVKETEKEKKMFIIAVTSKESFESSTENEVPNKTEERKDKVIVHAVSPTFTVVTPTKDNVLENVSQSKDQEVHSSTTPPVRKFHTRKQGRRRQKPEFHEETIESTPIPKAKHIRKFSEAYAKSTEPSTNGIPPEPEKQRSRYSSKYRSAYLDKPHYKATVPTVTPSTAWLKFFVTDPQLEKSVEEPKWFDGEDIYVTTEMSRQITRPSVSHESSLELVEGEEFQLGPDMNAISFTKTRSTLSSADLKLSESLEKASHIMNVETLQHSPSVTVSIFDALAEILVSTPRTLRLSSTTEVQKQNIIDTQILNGVSNSITVNNVKNLASQDTLTTTADLNSSTKSVQNTATIPTVINNQKVEDASTPSLNNQEKNVAPVNTQTSSTPIPTTPVSARKPFAIKVLYTEPPTDKSTTTESTSNPPSIDILKMVHNTVSDFLLTNNHLVSSELTSMLSNNINNLIENMDKTTRSKISADMEKLLKTLIPRALDKLSTANDDVEIVPNTTPYSLEEIKDTENVDFDSKSNDSISDKNDIGLSESLQSVVSESSVYSNTTSTNSTFSVTKTSQNVNSDPLTGRSTISGLSSQTTATFDANLTTVVIPTTTTPKITPLLGTSTPAVSSATDFVNSVGDGDRLSDEGINTNNVPLPFFTNFEVRDFTATTDITSSTFTTQSEPIPLTKSESVQSSLPTQSLSIKDIQASTQISPIQLWVLNRKARVLQMIEDLIRQNNNEIATAPPNTGMLDLPNDFQLSDRLTQILKSMSSTTESSDSLTETTATQTSSIPAFGPYAILTTPSPTLFSRSSIGSTQEVSIEETLSTTANAIVDIFSGLSFTDSNLEDASVTTEDKSSMDITTPTDAVSQEPSNNVKDTTTAQDTIETTTESIYTDSVQTNTDSTTTVNVELPTLSDSANSSSTVNTTKQNYVSFSSNVSNEPPKKDYVIFGILPNNTVVRKDPNDDILETLTEASPYIVYSLLPNNTVIRRFPNGTRVPRVMQKIDILPISPSSLRNPYSPIHNNPAIVKPHNPIRESINIATSTDTSNNGTENQLTNDTVNNQQQTIPTTLNINGSSSLGVTTATIKPPAEKSTASHVLSLRTSTMLPSVDEILLNSISSAVKEEMVILSMMSSTREPTILTLDIDPETKQIRTEKPVDGSEGTVFKYIPIDEVSEAPQGTNVLKLATKAPTTPVMEYSDTTATVTEIVTQTPQIETRSQTDDINTSIRMTAGTPLDNTNSDVFTNTPLTNEYTSPLPLTTTKEDVITTEATMLAPTMTPFTTITGIATTTVAPSTNIPLTTTQSKVSEVSTSSSLENNSQFQEDAKLLQSLFASERNPKRLNLLNNNNQFLSNGFTTPGRPISLEVTSSSQQNEEAKILQALLAVNNRPNAVVLPNIGGNLNIRTGSQPTTSRSIEDDLRQFEEDTKLLKALLAATGQNPANLNIPSLNSLNIPTRPTPPITPITSQRTTMTTTPTTTTTTRIESTTQSIVRDDLQKLREDAKLLEALFQATGQNSNVAKPIISSVTSNVRISSDPSTTSVATKLTTPMNIRPVYTSRTTTPFVPVYTTVAPVTTFQLQEQTTEAGDISSIVPPNNRRRLPTTTIPTARRAPSRFTVTTETPSTSTFSAEEDLQFLKNLKTVLKNNPNTEDPEAALANRIIALAVERSLNEIESGKQANVGKTGITTFTTPITRPPTRTTSTTTTTTVRTTTTIKGNTPSLEEDIKQFQEDTKLLQELIKATGQDPSKFNIPTLPPHIITSPNVSPKVPPKATDDLKILSNLLASPSPLNDSFEPLTKKAKPTTSTTPRPFGAKIVVKDQLKNEKDDAKLLQTLIKLQGVTETTTQKSKLTITGQSPDEALQKLIQRSKPSAMVSEATKAPMSVSTEYGKSNDALLAALLKEQGFGPTTASSLDEQLRLAALLNQVVVTPKSRRVMTTPPPPPPVPQRRPILDGLAWLWQQWRETEPGRPVARPNRRPLIPSASSGASPSSPPAGNGLGWLGSGPFVGNAPDEPSSNRVPLEPPRVVTSEQTPGRGQLVSAAINVTRAFSQFLGAAIAGAAQTVQNVIRAGQRAATDVYSTGSG